MWISEKQLLFCRKYVTRNYTLFIWDSDLLGVLNFIWLTTLILKWIEFSDWSQPVSIGLSLGGASSTSLDLNLQAVLEQGEMQSEVNLARFRDWIGREKWRISSLRSSWGNRWEEDGPEKDCSESKESDDWVALGAQGEGWANGRVANLADRRRMVLVTEVKAQFYLGPTLAKHPAEPPSWQWRIWAQVVRGTFV